LIATCRRRAETPAPGDELRGLKTEEEDTITELMEEQLGDLDDIEPLPNIEFEIGDSVVYPHHGAGKVLRKEMKTVLGESREYLTIKILHNDMTVMVPTENAALAGLRRVIDEETVQKVLAVLQDECSEMPKNWNRRFKHNRDKIKTGDIYELAEVVRNLAIREAEKGLSTGEKQMFTRAKKILASELMYALEMDEEQVEAHLTNLLLEGTGAGRAPAAAVAD
jgi:CarD family transcriptional regulator